MKIQTSVTETIEQVQVIQEVKKQKATVALEVDQDFVDLMNFFGLCLPSKLTDAGASPNVIRTLSKLWMDTHSDTAIRAVLDFTYATGFTLKPQPQQS